jgi:GGDEF domain-containing protein
MNRTSTNLPPPGARHRTPRMPFGQGPQRHLAVLSSQPPLPGWPQGGVWPERRVPPKVRRHTVSQRIAVLTVKLGGLASLEAQHGQAVGETLLALAQARLSHEVRETDALSRSGPDGFTCLIGVGGLPSRQRLNMLACALLECLSAPYLIGGVVRSVQAHIDVAICPIEVPELARQGADLT